MDAAPQVVPPSTKLHAWTDGSTAFKNPGVAGSACVLQLSENEFKVMTQHIGYSTNNVAELTAVSLLLGWFIRNPEHIRSELLIHSDSEYTIGVCSGTKRASANLEIVNAIKDLMRTLVNKHNMKVKFEWVKAHADNQVNNIADQLAKYATNHFGGHDKFNGVKTFSLAEFLDLETTLFAAKLSGTVDAIATASKPPEKEQSNAKV